MLTPHEKQFLLTKEIIHSDFFIGWNKYSIGDYLLSIHPSQEVNFNADLSRIYSIGNIYDYRNPNLSTEEIVKNISEKSNLNEILKEYAETCGESVLIIQLDNKLYLLNDACAQMEVYYATDFSVLGSQLKLLEKATTLQEHDRSFAKEHYSSAIFKSKKTLSYNATPFKNVLHLTPNHYLDLIDKDAIRFYPIQSFDSRLVSEVAQETKKIIIGYLKSLANRGKIALPITAGIDSRIILTCALTGLNKDELKNVSFFIIRLPWMKEDHVDIVIAKKLASTLELDLEIVDLNHEKGSNYNEIYDQSLFMHNKQFNTIVNHAFSYFGQKNITVVDGSLIGVSKNFFGNLISVTNRDLSRIAGYSASKYAHETYEKWIKDSKPIFRKTKNHILDMFFWEDRAGNWAANAKSKFLIVCNHVSIFNSRKLFDTMLQTKRKYRDAQKHKIFGWILDKSPLPIHHIPINPTARKKLILVIKNIGLYPLYRNLAIKLGLLKF